MMIDFIFVFQVILFDDVIVLFEVVVFGVLILDMFFDFYLVDVFVDVLLGDDFEYDVVVDLVKWVQFDLIWLMVGYGIIFLVGFVFWIVVVCIMMLIEVGIGMVYFGVIIVVVVIGVIVVGDVLLVMFLVVGKE